VNCPAGHPRVTHVARVVARPRVSPHEPRGHRGAQKCRRISRFRVPDCVINQPTILSKCLPIAATTCAIFALPDEVLAGGRLRDKLSSTSAPDSHYFRFMGLFSRFKKSEITSTDARSRRRRVAANPLEEIAVAHETRQPHGSLSPRIAGTPPFVATKHPEPLAAEEIRAAADPEDDNARGQLIQHERETEERNR